MTHYYSLGVTNILTFVENRRLCGNVPILNIGAKKIQKVITPKKPVKSPDSELNSKVSFSSQPNSEYSDEIRVVKRTQNSDEFQIMCFLTDLLSSLRKSMERNGPIGDELTVLKIGFQIILGT
jgi:hypothetical protein